MEINDIYKMESGSSVTTQTDIDFYEIIKGCTDYFGTGKYIKLSNGNEYAIIGDVKYKIVFNKSEDIKVTYVKLKINNNEYI